MLCASGLPMTKSLTMESQTPRSRSRRSTSSRNAPLPPRAWSFHVAAASTSGAASAGAGGVGGTDTRPAAPARRGLAERADPPLAAARRDLPRRGGEHLGRRVGWRGGDGGDRHRAEVGKVVADVEDLIEGDVQLLREALRFFEFVRRALPQLEDAELSRAPFKGGRAARRDERDLDARLLRQLHGESVADVEVLDLTVFAHVDDPPVGPDAVDVADDEADVGCVCHHQCRKWRSPVKTIVTPRSLAAATTSASRTEPPGWMTARTPASTRMSRPSRKGKKASEAAKVPEVGRIDFMMATFAASTRLI